VGLVSGDHEQLEEPLQLAQGESLAVDLGVDDEAPHVVARVSPAPLGLLLGAGEHSVKAERKAGRPPYVGSSRPTMRLVQP
jgi:hypothetical protein